jgi:hypothetical protein
MPSNYDRVRDAYRFLRRQAQTGQLFSAQDLATAAGWKEVSAKTYLQKHWEGFFVDAGSGKLRMLTKFLRVTEGAFLRHQTQKKSLLGSYRREFHTSFVSFEFLLPLRQELELRRALDQLFYLDTLTVRIKEIGLRSIETVIPRDSAQSDEDYIGAVLRLVSTYFGGYSISHVQGRFRANPTLLSQGDVGTALAIGDAYLIDETTALVRFIVPCSEKKGRFLDAFGVTTHVASTLNLVRPSAVTLEVGVIRELFFGFFVEAIVDTVRGEDEIWLIESSPDGRFLYKWVAND